MDASRFTEKVQEALSGAQATAIRLSHRQVDVEHLLVALLGQERGLAPAILQKAGIDVGRVKRRIEQELDRLPKVSTPSGPPEQIYITSRLNRLLVRPTTKLSSSRTTTPRLSTCCWRWSTTAVATGHGAC